MKNEHVWRLHLLGGIFSLLSLLVIGQLVRVQFDTDQGKKLEEQWKLHQGSWRTVFPARGLILDRNGNLLAGNEIVYEVGVDLTQVKNPQTIALTLNVVLGLDYVKVQSAIENPPSSDTVYLVLDDFVTKEKINRLNQYKTDIFDTYGFGNNKGIPSLDGLVFTPHLKRIYPEEELASNLIGFVGRDDNGNSKGYFGVEAQYDNTLAGTPVNIWVPNDPKLVKDLPVIPDGTTLVLTIDREIQASVEKILDDEIDSNGAESGTIVVIDPKSGEIIALATTPRLDLNEYWRYGDVFKKSTPFDRGVSQAYEPGSVYKVLTMAAALDKGAVKPKTQFLDTGVIEVGGAYIYNWNRGVWGPQNMTGCLEHSLNVCLAWVATQLGAKDFYSYMQNFGIGHTTGVDLAGEVSGRLKVPGDTDWYEAELGTNAFGQGVSATPLQMASAISAVANEGKVMVPHIVRARIIDGHEYETEPRVAAMPISTQTAITLTQMLANSLENEASVSLVDGYRVAGKTGTGEIPTPYGYTSSVTNASFVGWAPIDDPRFLVYIWLEKPKSSIWGSEVAAPIFPEVVEQLVIYLNIPPDKQRRALLGQGK
jgi:cell division protein FtsI/penicillin-binding protein 2